MDKIKNAYLKFESKVPKRAAIIACAVLLVGMIIAICIASANAEAASKYNALVDAFSGFANGDADTNNEDGSVISSIKNDAAKGATPISDGDVVLLEDKCEFYADFSDITDTVKPPKPGSYYSYYDADDGNTYVELCIAYKNLTTDEVDADSVMSATLVYDGKYKYSGFSCIEDDSRSDFTYSNITSIAPLSTEYLHYLFEVPDSVGEGTESIVINFTIGGKDYTYTVR